MEIRIRPMTLDDVPQVHAIDVTSFTLPWTERSFRFELSDNPGARLYVAEAVFEDGTARLAGMIVVWIIVDEAHVATIAVHPDFRRLGIGRRLLAAALLGAAQEGARQAFLEVRRGNLDAQALYAAFRFEVVGVRPRYYKDNHEDALLMTLFHLDEDTLRRLASPEPQE